MSFAMGIWLVVWMVGIFGGNTVSAFAFLLVEVVAVFEPQITLWMTFAVCAAEGTGRWVGRRRGFFFDGMEGE